MNLPAALQTVWWLSRDTLRQSLATRLFWIILGVSLLSAAFCLTVEIEEDNTLPPLSPGEVEYRLPKKMPADLEAKVGKPTAGQVVRRTGDTRLSLGFGLFQTEYARDTKNAVRFLQLFFAGLIGSTTGVFVLLIWTSGFITGFVEPQSVSVLLAKPIPRWSLLVGKFCGVMIFVIVQTLIFVVLTWLCLGLATGVFDPLYLATIPLLVIHFGIFFTFSTFVAVVSRNAAVAAFGAILFWILCWGINFGRHVMLITEVPGMSPTAEMLLETAYWIFPKPADMGLILYNALGAGGFLAKPTELSTLEARNAFEPVLSLLASLGFGIAVLWAAAFEFSHTDY